VFGEALYPEISLDAIALSDTVSVIDTVSNRVTATIDVARQRVAANERGVSGADPLGVAITPDGATAYIANGGDSTVSVLTN